MHISLLKELLLFKQQITDGYNRNLILKNNAPFINCISKINNVLIDNAEDLDVVMPMHNLVENSKNYSKTSGTLWNYTKDISVGITGKTANDETTKEFNFLFH